MNFRDLTESDKYLIFEWIKNDELRKMIGTRGEPTLSGHDEWFKKKIEMKDNIIKVIESDVGSIGLIGTNFLDLNNYNAEMFLYIGKTEVKRKGYGKVAVNQFVKYLFENYNLKKVTARIFSINYPSIKLFQKCGFVLEGCQKYQIMCDREKGELCDLLWYAFYNERWEL